MPSSFNDNLPGFRRPAATGKRRLHPGSGLSLVRSQRTASNANGRLRGAMRRSTVLMSRIIAPQAAFPDGSSIRSLDLLAG